MSRRNSKTSILQRKGLAGRLISVLLIMTMVLAMMPSAVWAAAVSAETSGAAQVEAEQPKAEQAEPEQTAAYEAAQPVQPQEGAKAAGGAGNCNGDHTGWTAWTGKNTLPETPGQYYLTGDVVLYTSSMNKWRVPGTTTICLNGHSIVSGTVAGTDIAERDYLLIEVGNDATLNLHNCKETGHISRANANYGAVSVYPDGVFNMYGGTIKGSSVGVYIDHDHGATYQRTKSGRFNMYGGRIENCTNGAVWVDSMKLPDGGFYFYGGDVDGTILLRDVEGNNLNTVHVCGSSDTPLQINPYNEQPVIVNGPLQVPLQFHRLQGENVSDCLVEPAPGYTLTAEDTLKITVVNGSHDKNIIPVLDPTTKKIVLKEVTVLNNTLTLDAIHYGQQAKEAGIHGKVTIDDTTELAGRFWIDDETVYNAGTHDVTVNFQATGRTDTLIYTASLTVNRANTTLVWEDDQLSQTVAKPRVKDEFILPTTNSDGAVSYAYRAADAADTDTWTDGLPTECGTYKVMASVPQTTNYNAAESSNTVTLTILDVPKAPTITGVNLSDRQAEVTWDTPTDPGSSPVTGYEVKWLKDGVEVKKETLGADVHSATFTLADETKAGLYTCVVAAKNDTAGLGAEANKQEICISMKPVITVVNIGHSFSKESYVEGETLSPNDLTVYLTYNYGYNGRQEVTIEQLDDLGAWFTLIDTKQKPYIYKEIDYKTYPLTLEDNPCEVHLKVPTGLPGESFDCYLGSITVGKAYPGPPQNLNAKPGDEKLIVTWKEPTITYGKEIIGYTIVCEDKDGNVIQKHEVNGATHELTLNELTNGETYTIKIQAKNSNGLGETATITGKSSAYATIRITPHATLTFGEKIDEVSQKRYTIDNSTGLASLDGLSVEFESETERLEDGDSLEVTFNVKQDGKTNEGAPRYTVEPVIKVLGLNGTEKTNHNYTFITETTDLEYLKRDISDAHGFLGDGLTPLLASQPYSGWAKNADNILLRLNESTDFPASISFPNGTNSLKGTDYTISFLDANKEKIESVVLPGKYTIIATGIGLCTGEYCAPFTITKKDATITALDQRVLYGDAIATEKKVRFQGSVTFDEVQQVTLTPSGLDVGTHMITPSDAHIWNPNANEDRTDCYSFNYAPGKLTITKAEKPTIAFKETSINMEYNNGDPIPNPTEDMLTFTGAYYKDIQFQWQDADGTVLDSAPTGTGNYKLKAYLEDNANHGAAEATVDVTVVGRKLTEDNMTLPEGPFIYNGSEQKPSVTVKDGETVIDASRYIVTYKENINAGTATVTVTDKNANDAYEISGTLTFTIDPKTVTDPAIELKQDSYEYDGSAKKPDVTVKDGDIVISDSEYTVTYSDNTNVGTNATVTITDNEGGNYIVSGTKTFEITKSSLAADDVTVTLTGGPYTYDGTAKEPTVAVKKNSKTVDPDEYTIAYSNSNGGEGNHTNAGTVTVTVTAKENGNYTGSTRATFTIGKASITDISAAVNDVKVPEAKGTVQNTVEGGSGYSAGITWKPADSTYGFNTEYTATLTLTPDKNHVFGALSQDGWNVKVGEDGTATLTKTFSATRKEKIKSLDTIGDVTLKDHTDKDGVIKKLPTTVNAATETGKTVAMALDWSCEDFKTNPNAENTFNWTVTADERYEASDVTLSGSITVTNPGALPVSITGTDKKASYSGSTIDVSKLFKLDENAGAASYSITGGNGGTGEGTLSGSDLTVTKVGTFNITVQTAADGIYAAGEASATLTVNPKAVTPKLAGTTQKTYDGSANAPAGLSIELEGLVKGDAVTASAVYSYDSSDAGDRTIIATDIKLSGADSGNYVLSDTQVTAAGKITKKAPVITFGNQTITYGGKPKDATADSNGTFTYSYVNKENAADTGGGWPVNAGTYTVTATVAETDNYQSGSASATVTIGRKEVNVSVTANGGVYNGEAFPASAKLEGVVDNETVNVTLTYTKEGEDTGSVTAPANAGNYTVTATITDSNYELTGSNSKDFTISPKEINIKVTVKDKEYDGTTKAEIESADLVGLIEGDKVTLSNGTATFGSADIGESIPISFTDFTISGEDADNYTLAQPKDVTATIASYVPVENKDYTLSSGEWMKDEFVVTAGEGFLVSTDGTNWVKSLSASDETANGKLAFYVKNKNTGAISAQVEAPYKIDKTVPTGSVTIGKNTWTELKTGITFDQTFKEKQQVSIEGTDTASGIGSLEYLLANKELSADELSAVKWTKYENPFFIEKSGKYVVYVKITDKAGNETLINSNGIAIDIPVSGSYPVAPSDNVTNSGTAGTDSATTTADLNTTAADGKASAVVDQATADKIVDKAASNESSEVVIDATTNTGKAENTTVTLPTDTVQKIADKTDAEVTIKTDAAEMTLDQKSFEAVASKATGSTVEIIVEKTKDEAEEMDFELKLVSGGVVIGEFDGGNVKVTVKLNAALAALRDAELTCVHIDDSGLYSKVKGAKNNDGTYTFVTSHFSSYAIMAVQAANEHIIKGVQNTYIKIYSLSKGKASRGKGWIRIWYEKSPGYKVDYYEVFRSKNSKKNFGKTAFYKTKKNGLTGWYKNTKNVKKGNRYYYKIRGVRVIDGKKYYTKWSNTIYRTGI